MSTTIDDPNITLFDGSSWKQYNDAQGGWHGATHHETCDDRDDLTFVFSGTAIQVYGAKRPTYGYYYAELDGENRRFFNAHSVTDEIPALLFEAKDLDNIEHSLWFMNQQNYGDQRSRSCIGVDYIVVQQSNATGAVATQASNSDSAVAVSQPPGTVTSDPNAAPVSTDPASATPSPSSSVSPDPNTEVGQPITSTSTGGNALTVPNIASYTIAPSAAEVTAPNATWVADSAITAVTGRPGVYSGQPMPVYTAIKYDAAPRLQQEVFASAVRAGATTNAGVTDSTPSISIAMVCVLFWSVRRFWVI